MATARPDFEALIVMQGPLSARARGRDAVDLALACLALGWRTAVLLIGPARQWLHAQNVSLQPAGPDPFPRTLASLPLYELAAVHVLVDGNDDLVNTWPNLGGMPVRVVRPAALPSLLRAVAHVFHP